MRSKQPSVKYSSAADGSKIQGMVSKLGKQQLAYIKHGNFLFQREEKNEEMGKSAHSLPLSASMPCRCGMQSRNADDVYWLTHT